MLFLMKKAFGEPLRALYRARSRGVQQDANVAHTVLSGAQRRVPCTKCETLSFNRRNRAPRSLLYRYAQSWVKPRR